MPSKVLAIEEAVLGVAKQALSLPDNQTHLGPKRFDDVPPGSVPYAYTFGFERTIERGDTATNASYAYTGSLVVLFGPLAHDEIRAQADLIDAALIADRTLGGIVAPATTFALSFVELDKAKGGAAVWAVDAIETAESTSGELIQWSFGGQVALLSGLVTDYLDALAASLVTTLGATRLSNDIGDPLDMIAAASTRFQLNRVAFPAVRSSNETPTNVAVEVTVWHRLTVGAAERTYTEGAMLTQTVAVLAPDYLKAGLSTVDVLEVASLEFPSDIARVS